MSFTVTLRFAGLCALVPDAPLDAPSKESPKRLWVVMPNATKASQRVCGHFFAMCADASRVKGSGLKSGKFLWRLWRKEITFALTPPKRQSLPKLEFPSTNARTDFRYIADLGKIAPAAANVHPDAMRKTPSGIVIARVVVEHGVVGTLERDEEDGFKLFFPGGDAYATEAQAIELAYDATVAISGLDSVRILARDLDTDEVEPVEVDGAGGDCELFFGNLCGDTWAKELGEVDPYEVLVPLGTRIEDSDFEAFYKLSTPANPTKKPVPTWGSDGGGSPGGAKCRLARFNPYQEKLNP